MNAVIVEAALNLLAVGIERGVIIGKVKELEDSGASQQEIADALQKMRKDSEQAVQDAIDKA